MKKSRPLAGVGAGVSLWDHCGARTCLGEALQVFCGLQTQFGAAKGPGQAGDVLFGLGAGAGWHVQ